MTLSQTPYDVSLPEVQLAPVVVNSPHSGRHYPDHFLETTRLGNLAIRKSEDFGVDLLVHSACNLGMPILNAVYPRAYVDVNREPYELDPAMFSDPLPHFANKQSIRVNGGLGTVPRVVAEGEEIYGKKIAVREALHRIDTIYQPYHDKLHELVAGTHARFGAAILLDFHSMPSSGATQSNGEKADIVLGDRFGSSCHPDIIMHARQIFSDLGYDVAMNRPYAGGFITEHYGRPASGFHALQIEINRALYMDEIRIEQSRHFPAMAHSMESFFERFIDADFSLLQKQPPIAAE